MTTDAWTALGIVEVICVKGLVVSWALYRYPMLTEVAATALAIESLVFIHVRVKNRENVTIVICVVPGLLMGFIAYSRMALRLLA